MRFEPKQALTDGKNGLADLQTIIHGAAVHLKPQGQLWVEHGWDQAAQVRLMLCNAGYSAVSSKQDLAVSNACRAEHINFFYSWINHE